ncbi:organomercurial lyase [Streptomyces sp. NPDC048604]|uniref:organomercurial lyase n=1 Tax=Streptomyces sp. NPDC048604 TaxID=3365578 RepID=UPI0037238DF8
MTENASTTPMNLDDTERVRLAVYHGFARTGRAPGVAELAALTVLAPDQVRQELRALHASHDVVLDPQDHDRVVMAHPFAAVPLGFSLMGAHTLWWGGCAWDSFALPHLLRDEPDVLVATRCPACDTPHACVVGREEPPKGDQVAHFLTPMSRAWDDVVRTCGNQRLFCSTDCVDTWLRQTGQERGYRD